MTFGIFAGKVPPMAISPGRTVASRPLVLLLLGALSAWGAWLRCADLAAAGFWIDEGFSVVHARGILEHGYPLLPSGVVSWSNFTAHYLIAAGLALFGEQHAGARLLPALAGALLTPAVFLLARALGLARPAALVAAALTACSGWEIAWSRQARFYTILVLLGVLGLAFVARFLRDRRVADGFAAVAFLFAALATGRAGYLFLLAALLIALAEVRRRSVWAAWRRSHPRAVPALLILGSACAAVLFIPTLNSGMRETVSGLTPAGGSRYALPYARFLLGEFGFLLAWAALGAAAAAPRVPFLALTAAGGGYLVVLSAATVLFHYRYLLPLAPLLHVLAAAGLETLWQRVPRPAGLPRALLPALLVGSFLLSLPWTRLEALPKGRHDLDDTAPQPAWREAYAWVRENHRRIGAGGEGPVTISAFPMFHDLYLGPQTGDKYFLPFSPSGRSGDVWAEARYSRAHTLQPGRGLPEREGYVILDDFAFRMLEDQELAAMLRDRGAVLIPSPGGWNTYIWRIGRVQPAGAIKQAL